jgi:indole-3-glycerol phosphate synthase
MATKELVPQLEVIVAAKRQALMERKSKTPIEAVRALASMQKRPQPVLSSVRTDTAVMLIGQVRYRLPQTGPLSATYDPVAEGLRYVQAGAEAVALFTDETLYHGGLDDLVMVSRAINVPVISQDFVLDEYQVIEARAAGASALVLCASLLEQPTLRNLVSATQRNRMTAIVEVRNRDELEYALTLSPYVVGISTHDLNTQEDISPQVKGLFSLIPRSVQVMLTEGLKTLSEVEAAVRMGVDAVLIEESVLAEDPAHSKLQAVLRRQNP